MKVFHISPFKWYISIKHSKENNSCTPHVNSASIIPFFSDYFRGNIGRSTTLIIKRLSWFDLFSNTEICDLDMTLIVKKDVFQFNVSMKYILWMNIADSFYDLFEQVLS